MKTSLHQLLAVIATFSLASSFADGWNTPYNDFRIDNNSATNFYLSSPYYSNKYPVNAWDSFAISYSDLLKLCPIITGGNHQDDLSCDLSLTDSSLRPVTVLLPLSLIPQYWCSEDEGHQCQPSWDSQYLPVARQDVEAVIHRFSTNVLYLHTNLGNNHFYIDRFIDK